MKLIALAMLSCLLTGCIFTKDHVDIEYKPLVTSERIIGAENIVVTVNINDVRFKENIDCKINDYGMEMTDIMANNGLAEFFKNVITSELEQRGFVIAPGGIILNIELCKFFNYFKSELFNLKAESETILSVVLKEKNGRIVYYKTIIGFGEEHVSFIIRGNDVSLVLEKSLHDALQKLMNDPDFMLALLSMGGEANRH